MAAPSLAIGIGLQGKPIDRATLQMQREIGAQKAVQRKQEQALKELEPFKKTLMDLNNQAYIPVQRELLARKTAGVMKYMTDNIGRIDNYQLSTMINDLASDAATYKSDFQSLSKLRNNDKFVHLQPELEAVFTESVPENFNEKFANNPAFRPQLNQRGGLSYQVFEAKGADKFAQDFIKAEGENFFDVPRIEVIDGQKYEIRSPRQSEFPRFVNAAMSDPSVYSFEASQLFRDLTQAGNMPDVNSAEGKQQFDELLKQRIATKSQDYFNPDRYRPRPSGQGLTIINNMNPEKKGQITSLFDTDIPITYNGVPMTAPVLGSYNISDYDLTIPASSERTNIKGQKVKVGKKATYNRTGISFVVAKPKEVVVTQDEAELWNNDRLRQGFEVFLNKSKSSPGKRVYEFPSGSVIPSGLEDIANQKGVSSQPKFLAWGLDADNNWFYDNAEGVYQSAYMKESDKDKGALSQIFEAQKARLKELGGSSTAPAPAQTPTKTPAPAKGSGNLDKYKKYKR
jgi:hypothetical protein